MSDVCTLFGLKFQYLFSHTYFSIKSLDLVCMKELDKRVNIIPVIAKADTVSRAELSQFKARVSSHDLCHYSLISLINHAY